MDNSHQRKLWVQRSFRDFCQEYFRLPNEQEGHWQLLGYLLLNPMYSELDHQQIGDKVMVPYQMIQEMYGSRDSAESILQTFETDMGIKLNVNGYSVKENLCRTVEPEFPQIVLNRVLEEANIPYKDKQDRVYFATGEDWTTYKQNKYRQEYLQSILAARVEQDHPAYELVEYLHSKRVQKWLQTQCAVYTDAMLRKANEIDDEKRRLYAVRIVNAVQQYAYVQYSSVGSTKRIYSLNNSVLALPREIRRIFYSGTWSLDLKFAQLTIVAQLWNLPKVSGFITSGGNIWQELASYLELDLDGHKPYLKEFLYSLFYGSSKSNLREYAASHFGSEKILSHELIQELLQARNEQLRLIDEHSGATDAFGEWISNEKECRKQLDARQYRQWVEKNNRSVLSAVVQSYELQVMLSLFEHIKSNNDLLLVGWLHDGIYIAVTNHKEDSQKMMDRLSTVISEMSRSLGMVFQLDREFLDFLNF